MKWLLPIALLLLISCEREDKLCMRKAGERQSMEVSLNDFDHVVLNDNIDLEIIQSNENKVVIEAGENVLPMVQYVVKADTLRLSNTSGCNWYRRYDQASITAQLHVDTISGLTFYGSGGITISDTLRAARFDIQAWESGSSLTGIVNVDSLNIFLHTGPCDVTISGSCDRTYAYSAGNGFIDLRDLQALNCQVNSAGTNDFYVWALNTLLVEISHIGDVYYKGAPTITTNISGSGLVSPLN